MSELFKAFQILQAYARSAGVEHGPAIALVVRDQADAHRLQLIFDLEAAPYLTREVSAQPARGDMEIMGLPVRIEVAAPPSPRLIAPRPGYEE